MHPPAGTKRFPLGTTCSQLSMISFSLPNSSWECRPLCVDKINFHPDLYRPITPTDQTTGSQSAFSRPVALASFGSLLEMPILIAKKVNIKSSHHNKNNCNYVWPWILTYCGNHLLIYTCIYVIHLKLIRYMIIILQFKRWKSSNLAPDLLNWKLWDGAQESVCPIGTVGDSDAHKKLRITWPKAKNKDNHNWLSSSSRSLPFLDCKNIYI